MKIVRTMIIVMLLLFNLMGCTSDSDEGAYVTPDRLIKQQSETIIEGIKNKDATSIESMFCSYARENDSQLIDKIEKIFEFIEGEIISYDEPSPSPASGESVEGEGFVKRDKSGSISNICTSNGKKYRIVHGTYLVWKEHPEYEGVAEIKVIDVDRYTEENNFPKDAVYTITYPEMYK